MSNEKAVPLLTADEAQDAAVLLENGRQQGWSAFAPFETTEALRAIADRRAVVAPAADAGEAGNGSYGGHEVVRERQEQAGRVNVQACRPEDRAMLGTQAGQMLLKAAAKAMDDLPNASASTVAMEPIGKVDALVELLVAELDGAADHHDFIASTTTDKALRRTHFGAEETLRNAATLLLNFPASLAQSAMLGAVGDGLDLLSQAHGQKGEAEELNDQLGELLSDIGWVSRNDAQWDRLRAAIPQIRALLTVPDDPPVMGGKPAQAPTGHAALDFDQEAAKLIRDSIGDGDEAGSITLHVGNGHSGHGVYLSWPDCREEGSIFVTELHMRNPQAFPSPSPDPEREKLERDAEARGRNQVWNDLMRRFSKAQRHRVANLMAHRWTLGAFRLDGHGQDHGASFDAEMPHKEAADEIQRERDATEAAMQQPSAAEGKDR